MKSAIENDAAQYTKEELYQLVRDEQLDGSKLSNEDYFVKHIHG